MADTGTNGERGSTDDLPWASVFDPAANARALSAIQAEGFRAASQIVDRFIRIVTPESAPDSGGEPRATSAESAGSAAVSDLEAMTRSWWSIVGRMLLQSAPRQPGVDGAASAFELGGGESSGAVVLVDVGGVATAEVWLHNRGSEDMGVVVLRCSDLMSADGDSVGGATVRFEPAAVPMPARSSRGVLVKVPVEQPLSPGVYRGTLMVTGHSELWLPVVFTAGAPTP